MQPRIRRRPLACLVAAATLITAGVAASPARAIASTGTASASGPITLTGASAVPAGGVARIHVDVRGVPSLGALQASLRYDHRALEIGRIVLPPHFENGGATRLVQTNEAVDRTTFGAWSCSGVDCGGRVAAVSTAAAPASQRVAEIDVEPLAAGRVELRLDGGLLADTTGRVLVRNATASFTLNVDGGAGPEYAAPHGQPVATPHTAHAATAAALDIDGDHTVSPRDPVALEPAWEFASEASSSCAIAPPGDDVDGDGCLSIADIQSVAGHVDAPDTSARRASAASPYGASPDGVVPNAATFVVDSTADAPDANADGVCATSSGDCTLRAAMQEANRGRLRRPRSTSIFLAPAFTPSHFRRPRRRSTTRTGSRSTGSASPDRGRTPIRSSKRGLRHRARGQRPARRSTASWSRSQQRDSRAS